jgi:hypothetical protein
LIPAPSSEGMDHLRAFVDQARRVELLVRVGPVAPAVGEPLAEPGARDLAAQLGLEPAAAPWVPLVTARSRSRSSACMSACRKRVIVAASFMSGFLNTRKSAPRLRGCQKAPVIVDPILP